MHMSVLYASMPAQQRRALEPIIDGCESTCGFWELNWEPLEEQPVLLTFKPSLQSLLCLSYLYHIRLWWTWGKTYRDGEQRGEVDKYWGRASSPLDVVWTEISLWSYSLLKDRRFQREQEGKQCQLRDELRTCYLLHTGIEKWKGIRKLLIW